MSSKIKDLIGQKFHRLTVIEFAGYNKIGRTVWKCKCDCGNEKDVLSIYLTTEETKSCGCIGNPSKEDYINNTKKEY